MNTIINNIDRDVYLSITNVFLVNEINKNYINDIVLILNNQYKPVDELPMLVRGSHIRWIRYTTNTNTHTSNTGFEKTSNIPVLTRGGILIDIQFTNGITLVCKLINSRIIKIKYDSCLFFQKMTESEWYQMMLR